jgi:hypothetical protein
MSGEWVDYTEEEWAEWNAQQQQQEEEEVPWVDPRLPLSETEHRARQQEMVDHGIPCRLDFEVYGSLWVLQVIPRDGFLHLTHDLGLADFIEHRYGKPYHISICKTWEAENYSERINRINEKFDGWEGILQVRGWGGYVQPTHHGYYCVVGPPVSDDEDIVFLHSHGCYGEGELHISF